MTRTTQYDHAALAKTLDGQLYVISRPQALACGLTAGALRHRTRPDGPWRALLPGVYLVDAREPNVPQREVAAMLYAGDGSMITGIAALWRHGIRYPVPDTVDVLVPALRKVQSTGFARLWRTTRLPARPWTVGGIRFAPAPRAVADAALNLTASGEVRAIVAAAVPTASSCSTSRPARSGASPSVCSRPSGRPSLPPLAARRWTSAPCRPADQASPRPSRIPTVPPARLHASNTESV